MKNSAALAIMLKAPVPGFVKTRLVPPLTHIQATALYERFLKDIFNKTSNIEADRFAAFTPENERDKVLSHIPEGIEAFPQEGADLGERMHNVFLRLFSKGYEKVVIIGSDSPDLPIGHIEEPLSLLSGKTPLVLGPAMDGGYYLIAMNSPCGEIFKGIRWSTSEVLAETLRKAKENSLDFKLLGEWYDVDTVEDMKRLLKSGGAPLSVAFLKSIGIMI